MDELVGDAAKQARTRPKPPRAEDDLVCPADPATSAIARAAGPPSNSRSQVMRSSAGWAATADAMTASASVRALSTYGW